MIADGEARGDAEQHIAGCAAGNPSARITPAPARRPGRTMNWAKVLMMLPTKAKLPPPGAVVLQHEYRQRSPPQLPGDEGRDRRQPRHLARPAQDHWPYRCVPSFPLQLRSEIRPRVPLQPARPVRVRAAPSAPPPEPGPIAGAARPRSRVSGRAARPLRAAIGIARIPSGGGACQPRAGVRTVRGSIGRIDSNMSSTPCTNVAPSRISRLQPCARGSSGEPGTAITSRPASLAMRAVISEPGSRRRLHHHRAESRGPR